MANERPYNRIRDLIDGLTIFMAHGGENVDAGHDEIRSGQDHDQTLTDGELALLTDAGWFRDGHSCQCGVTFDEDGDQLGDHEPACNDWMIFV